MHAFDVLGDPVRRHLIELLAQGELSAGELSDDVRARFGISQPAVSQHLKVLRESGFVTVRPEGTRRLYAVQSEPLREVDDWLVPFRHFWEPKLWALGTEISRGKKARRTATEKDES
ncbi:ArsR/SmtB family transcription factor [Tsukamurella ocularis]|uniref:ArsR/SmtB family transcription factor n=1 Tax=Tsukamurella ocularis TaxID=1970234 RepID=UPI00216912FD|nr:metalloregulator ArsR/SmtB family transcription factor [Tsukamurella ocularis]MCS3779089.1 DNA-binding transcriptional ArsR family regulator [Tsukamurella ocularis]